MANSTWNCWHSEPDHLCIFIYYLFIYWATIQIHNSFLKNVTTFKHLNKELKKYYPYSWTINRFWYFLYCCDQIYSCPSPQCYRLLRMFWCHVSVTYCRLCDVYAPLPCDIGPFHNFTMLFTWLGAKARTRKTREMWTWCFRGSGIEIVLLLFASWNNFT